MTASFRTFVHYGDRRCSSFDEPTSGVQLGSADRNMPQRSTVSRRVRAALLPPTEWIQLTSSGYDPAADPNSLYNIAQEETGAAEFWNDGYTGQGVGVALIDWGVVPVNGLTTPGKS